MRIIWSSEALHDVDVATCYGATQWPRKALELADVLIDAVSLLETFPRMGREGHLEGTRELVLHDYPFIIVYAVGTDVVTVLHIVHQRMRWSDCLPRLGHLLGT